MEDLDWEIIDDTVELTVYGVVYSACVSLFNKEIDYVSGTYYNDGLQELHDTKTLNILDEEAEFTLDEVVDVFEKLNHKDIEITLIDNED